MLSTYDSHSRSSHSSDGFNDGGRQLTTWFQWELGLVATVRERQFQLREIYAATGNNHWNIIWRTRRLRFAAEAPHNLI